jgi:hypothetical protein
VAGSGAIISLVFAEYLNRLFFGGDKAELSADDIPQWAIKLTAIGAIFAVLLIGVATRSLGTRVAVIFTIAKVSIPDLISSSLFLMQNHAQIALLVRLVLMDFE